MRFHNGPLTDIIAKVQIFSENFLFSIRGRGSRCPLPGLCGLLPAAGVPCGKPRREASGGVSPGLRKIFAPGCAVTGFCGIFAPVYGIADTTRIEPRPAGRRRELRRRVAHHRRSGVGQDARADLAHRLHDRAGRCAVQHSGPDLYEQGGRADALAHRPDAARQPQPLHPHGYLPLGLLADPARECRPHRFPRVVHHLRTVGLQEPAQDDLPRVEPLRRPLQAQRHRLAHLLCQEQPRDAGGLSGQLGLRRRGPAGADPRIRQHLQHLLPAVQAQRRDGFRRPAAADQHPAARLPRRAGALPGALQIHPGR